MPAIPKKQARTFCVESSGDIPRCSKQPLHGGENFGRDRLSENETVRSRIQKRVHETSLVVAPEQKNLCTWTATVQVLQECAYVTSHEIDIDDRESGFELPDGLDQRGCIVNSHDDLENRREEKPNALRKTRVRPSK